MVQDSSAPPRLRDPFIQNDGPMTPSDYDDDRGINMRWIAVCTHPHRELLAAEQLNRQHFATYCPLIRKSVAHARRRVEVLRPLFPGYIFAATHPRHPTWRPVLSTVGVRSVVRCGDQPSMIDDRFIKALKAREIDGAIVSIDSRFKIGQIVQINRGPLERLIGTIIEMDEKSRLVVLADLFNRPVRMQVEPSMLSQQPAASSQ